MKILLGILTLALLGACVSYSGSRLTPGEAQLADVLRVMGEPAMRWQNADGSVQLAYPRGPMGYDTFMAIIGPDGKLQRMENVLDSKFFARIRPGMTQDQVLRILGPSEPSWTDYFKARDELVWEWRYCEDGYQGARFDVLFDGTKGTVRSTMSLTEAQKGLCGKGPCWCAR